MSQRTVFSSIIIIFELRNIEFLKDFSVNPIHMFISSLCYYMLSNLFQWNLNIIFQIY